MRPLKPPVRPEPFDFACGYASFDFACGYASFDFACGYASFDFACGYAQDRRSGAKSKGLWLTRPTVCRTPGFQLGERRE